MAPAIPAAARSREEDPMLRQLIFMGAICVMTVLGVGQPAMASDCVGGVRLGGTVGVAMSRQEDLNETIEDTEGGFGYWAVTWQDSKLRGGSIMGGFAEYLASENWIIGAEFLRLSSSGGYDWFTGGDHASDVGYDAIGNLASVYVVSRLPLRDSPVALRLGAGVGYLFNARFKEDYDFYAEQPSSAESGRDRTSAWRTDFEATGSAFAFHALVGAEYELTDALFLSVDIAYRVASIDELRVDSISTTLNGIPNDTHWLNGDIEEGKILRWDNHYEAPSFSTTEGDKVGLDFGGLHFTLSVAYAF